MDKLKASLTTIFIRAATGLLLPCCLLTASAQQAIDSSHHVPADKHLSAAWREALWLKTPKVYRGRELETIGMPCGGIAAGQLCVRGDGTLADWWIANDAYNTGYGKDSLMNFRTALGPWKVCYQTFTPASYISQGFSVTVRQNGHSIHRNLDKKDFDDIGFTGEYPIATITYASKREPLPIAVSLDVFSPFIPLDARESATPGTVLTYTIRNTSGSAVDIDLTGWLQNAVGLDLRDSIDAVCRNRTVHSPGMTTVTMDLLHPVYKNGRAFPADHPYLGNLSLNVLDNNGRADADYDAGRPAPARAAAEKKLGEPLTGAVSTTLHLGPGETREARFLLTWYFPNRPSYYYGYDVTRIIPNNWNQVLPSTGATVLGNMYANWYGSSRDVALWLQQNLDRLSKATYAFHDAYYRRTTLPAWLVDRLIMPVSTLATETCQWWASDKFWAWEGVGSCVGTCTHVWNYEQALARLFPELERNVRERTDFSTSFQNDGSILARNGWGDVLIDGDAGTIVKAYREHLCSPDNLFLSRNWPQIRKAVEYLISQDGNGDGLIEKQQPNTFDIAFFGANTYVGALYLAALKAGARMALLMQDTAFAAKCEAIARQGSINTVRRLWTGEYFRQDVNLHQHPKYQYADGCLSDQLLGQTLAHLDGLGYLYPRENVKKTLESVWKYNWAPDVGVQNRVHPPERVYADPGEAGLLVCTWPHSPHMGEDGVRYRDEVWTGSEYQAATGMICEGMTEEGLSIIKGLDDRYDGARHNPFNEIECGDHYARAMASWGVLLALEDLRYDGPQKMLGFAPRVQPDAFEGFFTAAEGWGTLAQRRKGAIQYDTVSVAYGKVPLTTLSAGLTHAPRKVQLFLDGRPVPVTYAFDNDTLLLHFDELSVGEGQSLAAVIE